MCFRVLEEVFVQLTITLTLKKFKTLCFQLVSSVLLLLTIKMIQLNNRHKEADKFCSKLFYYQK